MIRRGELAKSGIDKGEGEFHPSESFISCGDARCLPELEGPVPPQGFKIPHIAFTVRIHKVYDIIFLFHAVKLGYRQLWIMFRVLEFRVGGVEALAPSVPPTVRCSEGVECWFEVENGTCDGFQLYDGVIDIWRDVDLRAAGLFWDNRAQKSERIPYAADHVTKVGIIEVEDRGDEFDPNWIEE